MAAEVHELPHLLNKVRIFRDRADAGMILSDMMQAYRNSNAIVLAIPSGGVPVGIVIANQLNLPLDLAVTSKITLPWNTEVGYGAVAFDGTISLNEEMISYNNLSEDMIRKGIKETHQKVQRRIRELRRDRPFPQISERPVIVVDDGLASGFAMLTTVKALKNAQAGSIIVAVPTAHYESIASVAQEVDAIYCPNIRSGWSFAVASAYQRWTDVSEDEVKRILSAIRDS